MFGDFGFVFESAGFFDSTSVFQNIEVTKKRKVIDFEIELFAGNSGTTILNDVETKICEGLILVAKPGQIRNSKLHFKAHYAHFFVTDPALHNLLSSLPDFIKASDYTKYTELFISLIEANNRRTDIKEILVFGKLCEIIHSVLTDARNEFLQKSTFDDPGIYAAGQAASYIDQNFTKQIDLAHIAKQVNLSPVYFHKIFKTYIGVTPHKYLTDKRLSHAKLLLTTTNMTVTNVAYESGFTSQPYFNDLFKRQCGISPLRFRKENNLLYPM